MLHFPFCFIILTIFPFSQLDGDELYVGLVNCGVLISEAQAQRLFEEMDVDSDGNITFQEFVGYVTKAAPSSPLSPIRKGGSQKASVQVCVRSQPRQQKKKHGKKGRPPQNCACCALGA